MKKLIIILVVTLISGFLTSCVPLFYGDSNYPHGRRYYANERNDGRRSSNRERRRNRDHNQNDNNGQSNEREHN
jgi:uncharacterized protein YxeA